ncbi:MAG: T9SS type A sorting domain-containing protein [Bacteroidota bacterium]
MRTRYFKNGILLFVFLFLFTAYVRPQQHYVQVKDTRFVLDGKPYYFAGTNFWYGCYLGSTGQTGNRERLIRELDRLKANGIDNLRILGASESSSFSDAVKPAIQISPGVYNDSLLIGLDFLLSEMNKRDMHAVIFLNNFWTWSGGMNQYNAWFGGGFTSFYQNANAKSAFRKYISDLIGRQNTVTGLYYHEDPAIMAWELANEPRPLGSTAYFYQWIDSTAQYIHSLDSNHLVTTGNEGIMGCNGDSTIFINAHHSASIDYATIHLWALNWGWYNPANSAGTYSSALAKAKDYMQKHFGYARRLNKPLAMEEFGLPRDLQKYDAGSTTTMRDQYFTALLQMIYDSAAAGSPIAGANFWGWGGEARSPNGDYKWRTGDPFMCDPPMEAQGLNSVYDTDSTTNKILKEHSALMAFLRDSDRIVEPNVVDRFILYQNFPNPFNPVTTINYDLKENAGVQLNVYNILGQRVVTLVDEQQSAGSHFAVFDAGGLSTGVYFYRLVAGHYTDTKKMLVVK